MLYSAATSREITQGTAYFAIADGLGFEKRICFLIHSNDLLNVRKRAEDELDLCHLAARFL